MEKSEQESYLVYDGQIQTILEKLQRTKGGSRVRDRIGTLSRD